MNSITTETALDLAADRLIHLIVTTIRWEKIVCLSYGGSEMNYLVNINRKGEVGQNNIYLDRFKAHLKEAMEQGGTASITSFLDAALLDLYAVALFKDGWQGFSAEETKWLFDEGASRVSPFVDGGYSLLYRHGVVNGEPRIISYNFNSFDFSHSIITV